MSEKTASILEKGYWEDVTEDQIQLKDSASVGAAKWCARLVRRSFSPKPNGRPTKLHRTAYLDGLRGFAALLVYIMHHELWPREDLAAEGVLENGWGWNHKYHFVTMPFVRNFFAGGHYAVTVFFVISGYCLSAKPISLIQTNDYGKLGDNLASALFRRWLRLNIPVICTTFCYITFLHAFKIRATPAPKASYGEEVWTWYREIKQFTFVFRSGGDPWLTYNFHAWSIPVEFKGSILIYTSLQALSKCSRNARLWSEIGLIFYFLYIVDGWFCGMFMSGMLICDLDTLALNDNLPDFFSYFEPCKTLIFYAFFVASMFLGGVPAHSFDVILYLRESFGWHTLSYLKPEAMYDFKWFYLFWAATFMVACIPRISWLKAFFETSFNQYLGRISFAFYLVHGPVLWILADRLYSAVGYVRAVHATDCPGWVNRFPLPKVGPLGLEPAFFDTSLDYLSRNFVAIRDSYKVIR